MKNFRLFLTVVIATMMVGATTAQTTNHVDSLHINVTIPGTLGNLILAETENFSDLKVLKISGELSYVDLDNVLRCTNLRKIDMEGVTNTDLGRNDLFKNSKIEEFILPEYLEIINRGMFYDADRMKRIILPPHLKIIDNNAFMYCDSLEYVECPSSLQTINEYAFAYSYKLRQVILREGLKTIVRNAFYQTGLEEIDFPNSLTNIGVEVCRGCPNLSRVTLPQGLKTIPGLMFYDCDRLTEIDIPASVETIENSVFSSCNNLETVHLPEGLRSLGGSVFYNTKLSNVSIPSTLVTMGSSCFYGCHLPTVLDIHCIVPPRYSDSGKPFPCDTIRVPVFSTVDYKQRKGWDQFNIQPLPDLPERIEICDNDVTLNLPALPADYKPSMILDSWTAKTYPSVVVNGNQTLSLSDYTQKHYSIVSQESNLLYYNSSLLTNTPMRADRVHLTYRGNNTGTGYHPRDCWSFFVMPFNAKMQDITYELQSDVPPTYLIYEYSGANRALGQNGNTWVKVADNATLQAGKGYILSANCDVTFHSINDAEKNNIFRSNDVEVTLEEHLAEFAHNRSWNLTGNPYPCWYDSRMMQFDAPFVVWEWCNYVTYTPYDDNRVLRPGEAFFVQRPVDSGTIVFPAEGRQSSSAVVDRSSGANVRHLSSSRLVYNLTLSGDGMEDRTRICVNPQTTMDYDMGRDASKFMSLDSNVPQLYTLYQGVRYSINERPEGDGNVTLGMRLPKEGTYTFTLSTAAQQPVTLIDLVEGSSTLMTDGTSHTFQAKSGDIDGRFIITLGDYTSITEVEQVSPQTTTTIYDLQGRRMNATGLKRGVYVVDGKKMVIGK